MLTVGIIHPAVRNHRDAVCFSDVTDFGCSGNAATPQNIWLKDVDQPTTSRRSKHGWQIPVFSCSERLPRNALTQGFVAHKILGGNVVFHPLQVVGFHNLADTHGMFNVKAGPRIQHQFNFIADHFSRARHQFFKLD